MVYGRAVAGAGMSGIASLLLSDFSFLAWFITVFEVCWKHLAIDHFWNPGD